MSELQYPSDESKVYCQICGKSFQRITPQHLKMHEYTIDQYKSEFPEADLFSNASKIKLSHSLLTKNNPVEKEIIEGDEIVDNSIIEQGYVNRMDYSDINTDTIKPIPYNDISENQIQGEIIGQEVEVIQEDLDDDPIIEYDTFELKKERSEDKMANTKEEILDLLLTYFPNVQSDYMIRNMNLNNQIVYEHITDFCDPVFKVVIDFPGSFIHNEDRYLNLSRDTILERDGWKIIKIKNIGRIGEVIEEFDY